MIKMVLCLLVSSVAIAAIPKGFVSLSDIDPSIVLEMRYAGPHNFIGKKLPGYKAEKCILTKRAAEQLAAVQKELKAFNFSLKIYDCYRPQKTVNEFVRWAKDVGDNKMKAEFYPFVDKKDVFKLDYVAEKSGHSRGSTVDLTIIPMPAPEQEKYTDGDALKSCLEADRFKDNTIDMGTGYDCFDTLAHAANPKVGELQRRNRLLLKTVMEKNGFNGIKVEWWHFTLKDEPHPKTYFDFDIE